MNLREIAVEFRELPLHLIDEPELPARSSMDDERMAQLVDDVRVKGVLVPPLVVRIGDRYEVIAGHRRRIAAGRAGLVGMRCVIYPTRAAALEAAKFSENAFREDLNPADEAIYFNQLLERDCNGDVDQLCAQLGAKRSYVEGRLLLFGGDLAVFEALQRGEITIGVAHELNKCSDERYRRYLLHQAHVGGATISVVRGWIVDWQRSQMYQPADGEPAPAIAPSSAVPETNYFTCIVCGGSDNVHTMRPLNVHQHCNLAILQKVLAAYRGDT